jgi:hypothetical protein
MAFSRIDGLAPIEELTLPFDPTATQDRVLRRRRQLRGRGISLGITVLVLGGIYLWRRSQHAGSDFLAVYGVVLAISLAWFLGYLVSYLLARRALTRVGTGIALRVGRPGVEVRGVFVPWADVVSLAAAKAGLFRSPLLRVTRTGGEPLSVPFDQIQVRPATLDLTARAYSAGRHGVDLEALDS